MAFSISHKIIIHELRRFRKELARSNLSKKDIFNLQEACKYTGLSESFFYKLTSDNKIPFSRPSGKLIFFKKSDVDAFLSKGYVMSREQEEEVALKYITNLKK